MKTIRISIELKDSGDSIIICSWCFNHLAESDSYCSNCGRYIDTVIDPIDSFEELYKYIDILNEK